MKEWIRKVILVVCAMAMLCTAAAAPAEEAAEAPAAEAVQTETAAEEAAPEEGGTAAEEAEPEAEKAPRWSEQLVEKVFESSMASWIMVAVLVVLGIIFWMIARSGKQWNARMLCMASLSIALSFVLSCLRLFRMPTHGAVTPGSMLPIMLFSLVYGIGPGMLTGLTYGVLQYVQDPSFLNIWQFLLDYLVAFSALGLAGIGKGRSPKWMYISIPIAVLGRAVSAILAGVMWAYEYIDYGLKIGEMEFSSPILYSAVYNGVYLIPETIICLLLAYLVAKPIMRVMKA